MAPPIPPYDIDKLNKELKRTLGVRVRNARYTNEYNCHGLTFISRLGWFFEVRSLLTTHGYNQIEQLPNFTIDHININSDILRSDIIVYYDGDPANVTHTGIVWSARSQKDKKWLTILSKWGGQSEYFHRHDRVPNEYGKSFEIWTDRKVI